MADSQSDVNECYALMDEEGVDRTDLELKAPIVMAFDKEGKLIGFLGTHFNEYGEVVGGPLVLQNDGTRAYTTYNICELYEIAMRQLGIKSYIMSVEDGSFFDQAIKRYNPPNLEQYAREGSTTFYIRRL